MAKAIVFNIEGKKIKEIELPKSFSGPIHNELIAKVYLSSLKKHPYAPYLWAGMETAASGKIRHARRKWKTAYGYGISRVPRKIMTRRGSRFFWRGAVIASTRGGREAHPPKIEAALKSKKINKKERIAAIKSAVAATASLEMLKKKYKSLSRKKFELSLPIVVESNITKLNTSELFELLKKILGDAIIVAKKKKTGKTGKARGKGSGLLIVRGSKERIKTKIFDVVSAANLGIKELAAGCMPGRLTLYTEEAIKELERRFG